MTSSVQVIAPLWHIATEKMADIMVEKTFKTLFAHYSLPTWCIYGSKDGR